MRPPEHNQALYGLLGLFLHLYGNGVGHGWLFISFTEKREKFERAESPRVHEISDFGDNLPAQQKSSYSAQRPQTRKYTRFRK